MCGSLAGHMPMASPGLKDIPAEEMSSEICSTRFGHCPWVIKRFSITRAQNGSFSEYRPALHSSDTTGQKFLLVKECDCSICAGLPSWRTKYLAGFTLAMVRSWYNNDAIVDVVSGESNSS